MKTNILKITCLLLVTLIISCENKSTDNLETQQVTISNSESQLSAALSNAPTSRSDCDFEYEGDLGPENWANLCELEWIACDGQAQSPVNINTSTVIGDGDINNININYGKSTTTIFNNGHTVQFNYDKGSSTQMNNIDYNLLQFHFHTGSEHTINGERYPMEMHLVHQDPNTGLLGVMGILFEEGEENKVLAKYINDLPELEDEYFINNETFKVEDLLPGNIEFYTYNGSLTTPGCNEIVTWYVIKETVTASQEQLEIFSNILHKNYRPIQDLNGRTIRTKL